MDLGDRADRFRFLIRDRDSKFTARSTPCSLAPTSAHQHPDPGTPGECDRGTLHRHPAPRMLDHLLIIGTRHLAAVLREYIDHYNGHRPHRALHQQPPAGGTQPRAEGVIRPLRRDRLGGLIHEYVQVA